MKLGKLKKLELRDYWKHEALHFTQWLAETENLSQLGDEIGLDITLIQTEARVGSFAVDILASEETTGKKIVIENQLEATNHSHLGQVLTYAAVLEAEYIVWVVREARDEHKQAIEWLNEHTDEKINIFLVQIELWQIGNSEPAPKFMIACRPNDWAKSVRSANTTSNELTETKLWQLEFWQQLRAYAATEKPPLKLRTPRPQHWYDVAIGRSDCHIGLTVMLSENKVGVELYIPNSKELFHALHSNRTEIEQKIGLGPLLWQELPEKKASRIRAYHSADLSPSNYEAIFSWIVTTTLKFKSTLSRSWAPKNQESET